MMEIVFFTDDSQEDNGVNEFNDGPTYERYSGTYAQDVAGFSDQDIDDALDGEPEAYWNID